MNSMMTFKCVKKLLFKVNLGGCAANNKLITKQIVIIMFTGRVTEKLVKTRMSETTLLQSYQ